MSSTAILDIPNGTLVYYRGQPYFVSDGVDGRIVTDKNGYWTFIKDLKWKTFRLGSKRKAAR